MTSFLLGGRPWTVEHVNHGDKRVRVRPAPAGQKPSWGGFLPKLLSFEVCQRVRQVLVERDENYPYADPSAQAVIDHARGELGDLLRQRGPSLEVEGRTARWWTFAGGRVNHTLKYGLEWLQGWRVVADNFLLRIEGEGVSRAAVTSAIQTMSASGFWQDEETRSGVLARVPDYRLSKFQPALPAWAAAEMVGSFLLDFDSASSFLARLRPGA
jgi:ATP-dependent Lhr-like helicase